ncbi:MAG: M24 family metallopeptidase [Solirubrobacterales bacterium]
MDHLGVETALVWQRSGGSYDRAGNVWYLSNYACLASGQESSAGANAVGATAVNSVGSAFAAVLLRKGHEPELHVSEPVHTVDRRYVVIEDIHAHEENLPAGIAARLNELGIEGKVAYLGDDMLPAQMYRIVTEGTPAIEWVIDEYLLFDSQLIKSEREIEAYREAGRISGEALTVFMEALIRGERQCDAAAAAAAVIIRNGGGFQRVSCHTGPESEYAMWDYPLYGYSKTAPKPGEMVRAWVYGPIFEGYWIDPGRSSVCGLNPSAPQRTLVENTVELIEAITAEVRPGVTPRQAGIVGDETASRLGYGEDMGGAIWDLYGHGLSTYFHGPIIPSHGAKDFVDDKGWWNVDRPFGENEVFTVEAFVREEGVGMASFEEIFLIGPDGAERLTDTPMLFW